MNVRTKTAVHFVDVANAYIELEGKARGLADQFFKELVELAKEKGTDNLLSEFDKSMIEVETAVKDKLLKLTNDSDITLGKYCSAWKVRKSELRKGVKNGLDPTKYESFSKFRKGVDAKTGGNSVGSNGGSGKVKDKNSSHNVTSASGGHDKLHSVTNKRLDVLDPAVQDKLNLLIKHLGKLDKDGQLKVIADCDSAIHKLAKAGGRFANVNTKNVA